MSFPGVSTTRSRPFSGTAAAATTWGGGDVGIANVPIAAANAPPESSSAVATVGGVGGTDGDGAANFGRATIGAAVSPPDSPTDAVGGGGGDGGAPIAPAVAPVG